MSAYACFRSLTSDDFSLLLEWLQREHVQQWWNDGDDTIEKVQLRYTRTPERTKRFILLDADGETPIGYFQYHLVSDTIIHIDQFLANAESLNQGLGTAAIQKFVRMICMEHSPIRLVVDPPPDTRRAIRCYEKVGFRHFDTAQDPSGTSAYMMEFLPLR